MQSFEKIHLESNFTRDDFNRLLLRVVGLVNNIGQTQVKNFRRNQFNDLADKSGGTWTGNYVITGGGRIGPLKNPTDWLQKIQRMNAISKVKIDRIYEIELVHPVAVSFVPSSDNPTYSLTLGTIDAPSGCNWSDASISLTWGHETDFSVGIQSAVGWQRDDTYYGRDNRLMPYGYTTPHILPNKRVRIRLVGEIDNSDMTAQTLNVKMLLDIMNLDTGLLEVNGGTIYTLITGGLSSYYVKADCTFFKPMEA